VQAELLTVNAVGSAVLPVCVPLNPICVDWPGGSVAFQARPVAVIVWPLGDQVAAQPGGVRACPAGSTNRNVQVSGAEPVLVRARPAVNPLEPVPHVLIV